MIWTSSIHLPEFLRSTWPHPQPLQTLLHCHFVLSQDHTIPVIPLHLVLIPIHFWMHQPSVGTCWTTVPLSLNITTCFRIEYSTNRPQLHLCRSFPSHRYTCHGSLTCTPQMARMCLSETFSALFIGHCGPTSLPVNSIAFHTRGIKPGPPVLTNNGTGDFEASTVTMRRSELEWSALTFSWAIPGFMGSPTMAIRINGSSVLPLDPFFLQIRRVWQRPTPSSFFGFRLVNPTSFTLKDGFFVLCSGWSLHQFHFVSIAYIFPDIPLKLQPELP